MFNFPRDRLAVRGMGLGDHLVAMRVLEHP